MARLLSLPPRALLHDVIAARAAARSTTSSRFPTSRYNSTLSQGHSGIFALPTGAPHSRLSLDTAARFRIESKSHLRWHVAHRKCVSSGGPSGPDQRLGQSGPDEQTNRDPEQRAAAPNSTNKPIARSISAARERTRAVREKVRSSLTNLNPRENIYNVPNLLTVSRLIAAPVTAYLLVHDHFKWALALFAYAGVTDLVDGWIARKWKLQTVAGSVIDPMADKALMIILTVTLAVKGAIPVYLATLILGRDASLAVAAIYYRYASLPAPKTFQRYWDFSLPSAEVHPTTVSKYNTFLQLMLIGSTLALPVVTAGGQYAGLLHGVGLSDAALHQSMMYFQWLVAGTTAWSGLSYAYLKDAVTILGSNEELKAKQGARGRAIIGVTFGSMVAAAAYMVLFLDDHKKIEEVEQEESKESKANIK